MTFPTLKRLNYSDEQVKAVFDILGRGVPLKDLLLILHQPPPAPVEKDDILRAPLAQTAPPAPVAKKTSNVKKLPDPSLVAEANNFATMGQKMCSYLLGVGVDPEKYLELATIPFGQCVTLEAFRIKRNLNGKLLFIPDLKSLLGDVNSFVTHYISLQTKESPHYLGNHVHGGAVLTFPDLASLPPPIIPAAAPTYTSGSGAADGDGPAGPSQLPSGSKGHASKVCYDDY